MTEDTKKLVSDLEWFAAIHYRAPNPSELLQRAANKIQELQEELNKIKSYSEPVIHACWTTNRYITDNDWKCINHREEVCSACGEWQKERSNFCPVCGAKMGMVR